MIKLKQLCTVLDQLFSPALFSDYCINGLQIEGNESVTHIGTAVSASLETIQHAIKKNMQALIVHHGLFWQGDSPQVTGSRREKLSLILKHNLSLIAYHLPMDAHRLIGNNWKAAVDLGWKNLEPFGYFKGVPIGVKGTMEPIHRQDFQKQLEKYYHHPATIAAGGKEKISSAALISGGAYKSIIDASKEEIDCFITGNFDEPAWNQAFEEKINFFAMGHSATERVGPKALCDFLRAEINVECNFIDVHNPF